jgi:integrase
MAGRAGHRAWGSIRRQKSRRWQASYVGPDLARHYAPDTFGARMDAEQWLADERKLTHSADWIPPKLRALRYLAQSKTLGDYAADWIEHRPLKPRTRIEYESLLRNQLAPISNVSLRYLNAETVRTWYAKLNSKTPRRNGHAYGLLHAVCATAVKDGLLQSNPCQIARAMNQQRKREPVILTVSEVAELALSVEPPRLKAFVLVSAWCGTRWGEAIELRRRDVVADCSVLTITRAVTHRQGLCNISTPKSGRSRAVVVPPHIRADLQAHLDRYVGKHPDALLFPPARAGCHFNDRVMRGYLRPALQAIGRDDLRIHDLRHYAGTQAARVGNLAETMARLGHSTVKASLLYQSIVNGRDAEVAAALSDLATGEV